MPKKFWKGLVWGVPIGIMMWGLILLGISHAADYYIDQSCESSGNGTTQICGASGPWKTIAEAFAVVTGDRHGDRVLIAKGTPAPQYREQAVIAANGTVAGQFTFGAYGSGANPIINGSDLVSTWTADLAGGWQNTISRTAGTDTGGMYDFRYIITANTGSTSGTKIRLTLKGPSTGSFTLSSSSIGPCTTAPDLDSTPTRITWDSGSNGTTLTTGTTKVSDEITFNFDKTLQYAITIYSSDKSNLANVASSTGINRYYYNAAANDYTFTLAPTWGSNQSNTGEIILLEVYVVSGVANVWDAAVSTEPKQVFFDETLGTNVASVVLVNGANKWYWSSNVLHVYSISDPVTIYTNPGIEASQRDNAIASTTSSYFTIDGITTTKTNDHGIYVHGVLGNVILQNCNVLYNRGHGISVDGTGTKQQNMLITNNTCSYNGVTGIFVGDYADTITISHNTVHHQSNINEQGGGIRVGPTTNQPAKNITIEYNNVYSNGTSATNNSNGIWLDTTGAGNIIRYNIVHDNYTNGIDVEKTSGASVYYNIVYNHLQAYTAGILLAGGTETIKNNLIYNNTIYNNQIGIEVDGLSIVGGTTGNLIQNNIVFGSLDNPLRAINGGQNDGTYGSGNIYTYNAFGPQSTYFIKWGTVWYDTYAAWETVYGGTTHSVQADPLFVSTSTPDFHLQAGSPAINAGVNVGLTSDYEGKTMRGRNIGAYESWPKFMGF